MSAKIIEVIETDFELRGNGTKENVFRRVMQYWSRDGRLLAEVDPLPETERWLRSLIDQVYNEHTGAGKIDPGHCTICTKVAQILESGVIRDDR